MTIRVLRVRSIASVAAAGVLASGLLGGCMDMEEPVQTAAVNTTGLTPAEAYLRA